MEWHLLLEAGAPCLRKGSWPCSFLRRKGFVGSLGEFTWRTVTCSSHWSMVGRLQTTHWEFQTGYKEKLSHLEDSQATGCAIFIFGGFWDQTATQSVIASCLLSRRLDLRPSDLLSKLNYPVLLVCQCRVKLVGLNCIFIQHFDNRCRCTFWCLKESAFNSDISSVSKQFALSSVKQGGPKPCCERYTP